MGVENRADEIWQREAGGGKSRYSAAGLCRILQDSSMDWGAFPARPLPLLQPPVSERASERAPRPPSLYASAPMYGVCYREGWEGLRGAGHAAEGLCCGGEPALLAYKMYGRGRYVHGGRVA